MRLILTLMLAATMTCAAVGFGGPSTVPVGQITRERYPSTRDRVALLIDALEEERDLPSDADPETPTAVGRLILEGPAAIEPLLHCLEFDSRDSRKRESWGGSGVGPRDNAVSVRSLALDALDAIIDDRVYTMLEPADAARSWARPTDRAAGTEIANDIRRRLCHSHGLDAIDVAITVLDDDDRRESWDRAARVIERARLSQLDVSRERRAAALIARRMEQALATGDDARTIDLAQSLLPALQRLDRDAHVRLTRRVAVMRRQADPIGYAAGLAQRGNPEGLDQLRELLPKLPATRGSFEAIDRLISGTVPELAPTVDAMLSDPASMWSKLLSDPTEPELGYAIRFLAGNLRLKGARVQLIASLGQANAGRDRQNLNQSICRALSQKPGFPALGGTPTPAEYAKAIHASRMLLEKYDFTWTRLDRPATDEDVVAGRAMFSLEGHRRVWSLPDKCSGRWSGPSRKQLLPDRPDSQRHPQGIIAQAEEAWENGKWVRYVGFVCPGFIGKVRADEITFDPDDGWPVEHPSPAWRIIHPDTKRQAQYLIGMPMRIGIVITNTTARPIEIPAEYYRNAAGQWRSGYTMVIYRRPDFGRGVLRVGDCTRVAGPSWREVNGDASHRTVDLPGFDSAVNVKLDTLQSHTINIDLARHITERGFHEIRIYGPSSTGRRLLAVGEFSVASPDDP